MSSFRKPFMDVGGRAVCGLLELSLYYILGVEYNGLLPYLLRFWFQIFPHVTFNLNPFHS